MKHRYLFGEKPKKQEHKGNAAKDGFTTLEQAERGSYSPWGPRGLDLRNDEPAHSHDLGEDA